MLSSDIGKAQIGNIVPCLIFSPVPIRNWRRTVYKEPGFSWIGKTLTLKASVSKLSEAVSPLGP